MIQDQFISQIATVLNLSMSQKYPQLKKNQKSTKSKNRNHKQVKNQIQNYKKAIRKKSNLKQIKRNFRKSFV